MSQDWDHRLRSAYKANASDGKKRRRVRLPAPDRQMRVTGEGDHAVIKLKPDAIVQNMQDNAAAFEGWSLALRRWCRAERVTLQWESLVPPPDPKGPLSVKQRHYQRFLYRVERFRSLFDWFDIATPDPFAHSLVLNNEKLFLNVAGRRSDRPRSEGEVSSKLSPEYELECRLLKDDDFDRYYGFSKAMTKDRQFPVGLFSKSKPTAPSAIFPGGKGAIDLVCLDDHHLWIFELKAKSNISVGTLAELLFYVSVMRDAIMKKFEFGGSADEGAQVQPKMIEQIKEITGVMLGHNLHPLIADHELIDILNEAVKAHWNRIEGAPAISFRADQIDENNSGEISRLDV